MSTTLAVPLVLLLAGAGNPVAPPERQPDGGGPYRPATQSCLDEEQRRRIREEVDRSIEELTAAGVLQTSPSSVPLAWPLRAAGPALTDPGYHGISNFVDQNPAFGFLLDYSCGVRTYDLPDYNHSGTDYFTWPFGWLKMDQGAVEIVAAADGVIVAKADGNYDRNCDFGGGNWNAVYVRHADGSVAWYGHMKNGSTTSKPVGASVAAGEYLGIVGSSGNSTGPHLHFELYDGAGLLNDPYFGACNALNPFSWWAAQRPYYDSAVNAVYTQSAPPVFGDCPDPETPNITTLFAPGQTAYFATYYRDQLAGQSTTYTIRRPDHSVFRTWSHSSPAAHYAASYWYWFYALPSAPQGTWRFRADYLGRGHETFFSVGTAGPVVEAVAPDSGSTLGGTAVTITGANFQAGSTVTFGGAAATSVNVPNPNTITALAPPHATGVVDVEVLSPAPVVSGSLPASFFYTPPPAATSFYAVPPCRVVDTRQPSGPTAGQPLLPSSQNVFTVTGGSCGIPANAKVVALNVTAVQPQAAGHLRLYPGNGLPPLASAINYAAGRTRANNAIALLATDGAGTLGVLNGSAGTTHLVLDVSGYFR